jgi:hypothetical protein
MRVALFFLWFLSVGLGVPAAFLAWTAFQRVAELEARAPATPLDAEAAVAVLGHDTVVPPSDVRPAFPDARAAVMAAYADDTRLVLLDCVDAGRCAEVRQRYFAEAGASLRSSQELLSRFSVWRFTTAAGEHGTLVAADGTAALIAGPSEAVVEGRVVALRARDDVPALAWALSPEVVGGVGDLARTVLLPIGAWTVLIAFWFGRMASWAAAKAPAAGATPVDGATLRSRLLSLNDAAQPFRVAPGSRQDEIVVDWRFADVRWSEALRLSGRRRAHRIVLRLDDARHRVRAQDHHAALDWGAGASGGELRWRASRGITFFEVERETVLGPDVGVDGAPSLQGTYRFDLEEMKRPVVSVITTSGWEYRPVLTFWRPLGG